MIGGGEHGGADLGGAGRAARRIVGAWRARRGATAIEYAIILPVFLTLILGSIDAGRIMWTQVTLQRAVQLAARCASVNAATCSSAAATQTYAVSQAWGLAVAPSIFTSQSLACGAKVSASLPIKLMIPWIASSTVNLSANACHPLQN